MKKYLLLSAGILAALVANAESKVFPGPYISNVSVDAKWGAGADNGVITLINFQTGDITVIAPENGTDFYDLGSGRAVMPDGSIVGTTSNDNGAIYKDGKWTLLPVESNVVMWSAHDMTPDGKRVCGGVSLTGMSTEDNIMLVPCIWNLNEDGTYDLPVILPHPTTDYSGRVPQYVNAVAISADGKTIIGNVRDYTGFLIQPIVYNENVDGEWSYRLIGEDLINPDKLTFPKDPGNAPVPPSAQDYLTTEEMTAYNDAVTAYNNYMAKQPQMEDFMSDDSRLDYEEALELYYSDPTKYEYPLLFDYMSEEDMQAYNEALQKFNDEAPVYPEYVDFMSPDEKDEYVAACDEYDMKATEWNREYEAFMSTWSLVNETSTHFQYNDMVLTPDGTKALFNDVVENVDPMTLASTYVCTPYVFNLDDLSYVRYPNDKAIVGSSLLSDGTVFGCNARGATYYMDGYIMPAGETEFVAIKDYYASSPALTTFINDNMEHDVYYADPDKDYQLSTVRGTVFGFIKAADDRTALVSSTENLWDLESTDFYFTYYLDLPNAGVDSVVSDSEVSVRLTADGILDVTPGVDTVTVYDLGGRAVYTVDAPAGAVATGLPAGVYVVKAGNTVVKAVVR